MDVNNFWMRTLAANWRWKCRLKWEVLTIVILFLRRALLLFIFTFIVKAQSPKRAVSHLRQKNTGARYNEYWRWKWRKIRIRMGQIRWWPGCGLNAGAVAITVIMVLGLLLLDCGTCLGHFGLRTLWSLNYALPGESEYNIVAERVKVLRYLLRVAWEAGIDILTSISWCRYLMKTGNRDVYGFRFSWVIDEYYENSASRDAIYGGPSRVG